MAVEGFEQFFVLVFLDARRSVLDRDSNTVFGTGQGNLYTSRRIRVGQRFLKEIDKQLILASVVVGRSSIWPCQLS